MMAQTRRVTLPPRDHQSPKAELEDEIDIPGADMETLRKAFFGPVEIKREPPGQARND